MFSFFRMVSVALALAWPYPLTPWRSPLLRWRMETYGVRDSDGRLLTASELTPVRFFRFMVRQRKELIAFLRWASRL